MIRPAARIVTLAALALGLTVGAIAPAGAADYTGGALSTNTAGPGAQVTYTSVATSFTGATTAFLTLNCADRFEVETTAPFGSDGILVATVTIPRDARPGDVCVLTVTVERAPFDTETITIVGAPTDEELPNTGAGSLGPIAIVGAATLALGFAVVLTSVAARRFRLSR